jgi:hypothetical protein
LHSVYKNKIILCLPLRTKQYVWIVCNENHCDANGTAKKRRLMRARVEFGAANDIVEEHRKTDD